MKLLFLLAIYLLSTVNCKRILSNEQLKQQIHEVVDKALACSNRQYLPSLSLAVVRGDEVITTRGYGKRDISLPSTDPLANATEHTKFCIASMGKVHTAILLGKVMEEHEQNPIFPFTVNWYTKVEQLLGEDFYIVDDLRTEQTSVRDTVSHKLGIPYYQGPWWYGMDPTKARVDFCMRYAHLDSVWSYREYFTYSDMSYVLAGCLTEVVSGGTSYTQLSKEKLYDPLGMVNTTFPQVDNDWSTFALPYSWGSEPIIPVNPKIMEDSGYPGDAAGGHWSSAVDMAVWLRFMLNRGMHNDQRVVSDDVFYNVYWPEFTRSPGGYYKPRYPFESVKPAYGLGVEVGNYREYRTYTHGGGWYGFGSLMTLFPDMNIGIYTGTSGNSANIHAVLHHYISDLALGLDPFLNDTTICTFPEPWVASEDWKDDSADATKNIRWNMKSQEPKGSPQQQQANYRANRDPEPFWYTPYVGVYGHKLWGNMTITHIPQDFDNLQFTVGRFGIGTLTPRGPATFNIVYGGMLSYSSTSAAVWFQNLEDGEYQELVHQDYQWNRPPVFTRGEWWDGDPILPNKKKSKK